MIEEKVTDVIDENEDALILGMTLLESNLDRRYEPRGMSWSKATMLLTESNSDECPERESMVTTTRVSEDGGGSSNNRKQKRTKRKRKATSHQRRQR